MMNLVEAYFLFPFAGAAELARRSGMTKSEVIEQLQKCELPMAKSFATAKDPQDIVSAKVIHGLIDPLDNPSPPPSP